MPPLNYTKSALTYQDQLQQLKDRGLYIEDGHKALFLLENVSYYRLSGYWYPMLQYPKSAHQFKPGSTFDQSFNLYCFDRELRKTINAELEKIEIAVRAKMIYILSFAYGPFWYTDSTLFTNNPRHSQTLSKLEEEYNRSREDFILAFKNNYTNPLPPSWMIFEIASFGSISNLYKLLRPGRTKRELSQYFGLDTNTFESWLHSIVYVRNLCAHHSRLWNKQLSIRPSMPTSTRKQWLNNTSIVNTQTGVTSSINNRPYSILSMILFLLQTVNPKHRFKEKIIDLFDKCPNVDPLAMGFTTNWQTEPLWQ